MLSILTSMAHVWWLCFVAAASSAIGWYCLEFFQTEGKLLERLRVLVCLPAILFLGSIAFSYYFAHHTIVPELIFGGWAIGLTLHLTAPA